MLLENERIDDLQLKGLKIIQKKDLFCFGIDAVLLSWFADIKKNSNVIDLGTGTGIVPILLHGKYSAKKIVGLEIQKELCKTAIRSLELNKISDKIEIVNGDIREVENIFKRDSFDVVVSNPPYMKRGTGLINPDDSKAISRHEILCTIEDVIKSSSFLLHDNGELCMVHRPWRLVDIFSLMRKYNIEPKYVRMVYPYYMKKANLVLVKGIKNSNPELKILEPIYVYNSDGSYTEMIDKIYNRDGEKNEK